MSLILEAVAQRGVMIGVSECFPAMACYFLSSHADACERIAHLLSVLSNTLTFVYVFIWLTIIDPCASSF